MNETYFEVVDDFVVKHIPTGADDLYINHAVMPKEIFQECYKKWIEP